MNPSFIVKDKCRLCNSSDITNVLKLEPTPVGDAYIPKEKSAEIQDSYPLSLMSCKECNFVQLEHVVDPKIIYDNYSYMTSVSMGLADHFQKYADELSQQINPSQNSLVVDIGSNDGSLLRRFKERGMHVLGIDPAKDIARKATESGIETIAEFFTEELSKKIKEKYGSASIITSNNTFANIDNLRDFIKGIKNILSPNGVFVLETGYLADLIKYNLFDNIYHEHLSYFSVKSLEKFFRNNDLKIMDVNSSSSKGGSIRVMAQLEKSFRQPSSRIKEFMALETELKIDCPEQYKKISYKLTDCKNQTLEFLNKIQKAGKSIAGYGASVGSTTFIYHFNLSKFINFLLDDNKIKQGLYSPGHHIPVLSSEEIYEKKPDYTIILAWRYALPIIKKHQKYLDNGGHFILPFPEFKVY